MEDGLPDMKIECVYEDTKGVLWIGTHNRGLVRYDGDTFQAFTIRDGLSGDGVYSIIEDASDVLWIGTDRGLSRYDHKEFLGIDVEANCGFLWGADKDLEGDLWFGLQRRPGLPPAVCRVTENECTIIEVDSGNEALGRSIHCIKTGHDGQVWLGGESGMYESNDGTSFTPVREACDVDVVGDILLMGPRDLLVAAYNGVWRLGEHPLRLLAETESGPVSMVRVGRDVCMICTYDGRLLRLSGEEVQLIHQLNSVHTGGFALDKAGRLWIGTYGLGLYCYDETRLQITRMDSISPSISVTCLDTDSHGGLVLGTRGGLFGSNANGFSVPVDVDALASAEITSMLFDSKDQLWLGTRNGWIYSHAHGELTLHELDSEFLGYSIDALAEDNDGRIWYGSRSGKGFGCLASEKAEYFPPGGDTDCPAWVRSIEIDRSGGVWLGSASPGDWDGICRYRDGHFERITGFSGTTILCLFEDCDARMWVGTNEGLTCIDDDYLMTFTQIDGLPSEIVTSVFQASSGVLWIGTDGGGISCYDGQVFQIWRVPNDPACNVIYDISEGTDGVIWFASEGGLIRYEAGRTKPFVDVIEVIADIAYPTPSEVQFPTTVGRMTLRFRGFSPSDHATHLVYWYRLQGYENDWQQTRNGEVEYYKLQPGEYVFFVQAVDRDLNYSESAEVHVVVTEDPRIAALNDALRAEGSSGEFIGESKSLGEVRRQVREVAWTDLTVLVLGETGTGKGLAARAIHDSSERRDQPFIHVNCGALQEGLVDSELFGHERGAFTGAITRKLGKFELADKGTIFLDEIGDLPLEAQTRLLRVLQDRCIERVGGTHTLSIDVRVIAATNRDLVGSVRAETYRADLYYRLNVFPIRIPALRERREDTPLLAGHFVKRFAAHLNQIAPCIGQDAMRMLMSYDWPGNVRELEHVLQRAVILAKEQEIKPGHIGIGPPTAVAHIEGLDHTEFLPLQEHEKRYLVKVLEFTGGVIHGKRGAAELLNINPTTLRSRLQKLGLMKTKRVAKTN